MVFQSSAVKQLRETLRPKAIKAAQEKAERLTAVIGQKMAKRCDRRSQRRRTCLSECLRSLWPVATFTGLVSLRPSDTTGGPAGIAPETITVSSSVTVWFDLP